MLPKVFDYKKNTRGDYRLESGSAALTFLQNSDNKDIGRFGIMSRDGVLRVLPSGQGITIVDLGAAPGGWCQYLQRRYGTSVRIFALDILPMGALPGVHIIEGDFRQETVLAALEAALGTGPVHLVLSDMAPNISGVNAADQAGSMHLADLALEFARGRLAPNGVLLLKMFQGEGFDEFLRNLRQLFDKVVIRKPQASRSRSSEVYLVARNPRVR